MPSHKCFEELTTLRMSASPERFCGCGTRLSVYNPGPECNACRRVEDDRRIGLESR